MATAPILLHQATKPAIYTRIRTLARPATSRLADSSNIPPRGQGSPAIRPRLNAKQQRHPAALLATPSSARPYSKTSAGTSTTPKTGLREEVSSGQQATQKRMASDEDYMSFLNKANQDADDAHAAAAAQTNRSSSKTMLKAMDAGEEAPKEIREVCSKAVYVSDADEPFEAVSLRWTGEGGLPDEEEFAKLIDHWDVKNADISIMDPVDWDVQGQYKEVIEAVREASRGNDVRVYKVVRDKTRVEYFVVTREEGRIVGAKALAVES